MASNRQGCHIRHDPAKDPLDGGRLAIADGIGEDDRVRTRFGDLERDAANPVLVDRTLDRATKGRGEPAGHARAPVLRRGMAKRHDPAKIFDRFTRAAADIRAVMPLADRQHEIHLVHPERQTALSPLQVRDQRRDGEPVQG